MFITLMTTGTAKALSEGADAIGAAAAGVHTAFFWGAVVSVGALAVSLLVRRPKNAAPADAAGVQ